MPVIHYGEAGGMEAGAGGMPAGMPAGMAAGMAAGSGGAQGGGMAGGMAGGGMAGGSPGGTGTNLPYGEAAGGGGGAAAGGGQMCGVGVCGAGRGGSPTLNYVGNGRGDYIQETTYRYVGTGAGEFEVVNPQRSVGLWMYACGALGIMALIGVIALAFSSAPTTTTTPLLASNQPSLVKALPTRAATCMLWGDPHIIPFDAVSQDKEKALSFYGDGDFWLVRSDKVFIQGRFEGTKYTEGLAATNKIVVGGPFLGGHKIEVGTQDSAADGTAAVLLDGAALLTAFPQTYRPADGSFTVTYSAEGKVPDVVPEHNEKRIVHMTLPLGIVVHVYQWNNYLDVEVTMNAQPNQDGACGNFNGVSSDDTTASIMQRIGARVMPSENLLSGNANIDFTPQMQKMLHAECPVPTQATAQASCTTELGRLAGVKNMVFSCMFDICFGMNVHARNHAKTYA